MTLTLYMSPHCLSPHPSPSLSLNVFVAFFLLSNNSPSGPFSLYLSIHSLHICLFHPFWVQMLSKSLTAWVWHQLPLRSMRLTSDLGGGDEYVCMCCFESFHHAHYTFHHSSASFYSETKSAFNCMFALHIKASLVVVFIFWGGGLLVLDLFRGFSNYMWAGWICSLVSVMNTEEYSKCWILIWFYRHVDLSLSFTAKMLQHQIETLPCF